MTAAGGGVTTGADRVQRCPWANTTEDLAEYHDTEWGRRVDTDVGLYERLVLEAFQSGLSWLTILRKRDDFRRAFDGFAIERVAGYTDADVQRLLSDASIVRHRGKIRAAVANARAVVDLDVGLADLLWSYAPAARPAPRAEADVPVTTAESQAMARDLKRRGFRFVGPTTAYALMQATGMVNDHLADCAVRAVAGQQDVGAVSD